MTRFSTGSCTADRVIEAKITAAVKGSVWKPWLRCPLCGRRIRALDRVLLAAAFQDHVTEVHL